MLGGLVLGRWVEQIDGESLHHGKEFYEYDSRSNEVGTARTMVGDGRLAESRKVVGAKRGGGNLDLLVFRHLPSCDQVGGDRIMRLVWLGAAAAGRDDLLNVMENDASIALTADNHPR